MKRRTKEEIDVWRHDEIAGLELRRGVAVSEPVPRHWHETYQFCLVYAGGGELFYRGARHSTPSASLFIVHPGEVHSNFTDTGCSFRSIYVEPDLIQSIGCEITGSEQGLPFFPVPIIYDREIIADFLSLHLSRETSAGTLETEAALLEMTAKLITRSAQKTLIPRSLGIENRAVKIAREYIIEYHARNISLHEIARRANLSPFHLTRVFTKAIGMPPHAYQMQVRIIKAQKMILSGISFAAVAAMTGFADQSHFIRHFKRLVKLTPGQYLKNSKNVQYQSL